MLILDAIIKLGIGLLLVIFPREPFWLVGLPVETPPFYAILLGAVLVGTGIAQLHEHFREPDQIVGLGLGGAMIINLFGGLILAAMIGPGGLGTPFPGTYILGGVALVLLALGCIEGLVYKKRQKTRADSDDGHES